MELAIDTKLLAIVVFVGTTFACAQGPEQEQDPSSVTRLPSGEIEYRAHEVSRGPDPDLSGVRLRNDLPEMKTDRTVAAVLEIDRAFDMPVLPLAAPTSRGFIDLQEIVAEVGIELSIIWSDRDAFRFDLVGRRHIRRDPEWFVRPGSSGFGGTGRYSAPPTSGEDSQESR